MTPTRRTAFPPKHIGYGAAFSAWRLRMTAAHGAHCVQRVVANPVFDQWSKQRDGHAHLGWIGRAKEDSMFQNILVAFDGSQSSRKAYETALDISKKYDSAVHVVAVARPPEFPEVVETRAVVERERAHLDRQLGALRVKAMQIGLTPHLRTVTGHPARQIVRVAEEHKIDLIILGHRGHGMFDRWLLGSISRTVIAYAHCPVMVVR